MPNGTYGGVRGKETKIGRKNPSFPYLLDFLPCGAKKMAKPLRSVINKC